MIKNIIFSETQIMFRIIRKHCNLFQGFIAVHFSDYG